MLYAWEIGSWSIFHTGEIPILKLEKLLLSLYNCTAAISDKIKSSAEGAVQAVIEFVSKVGSELSDADIARTSQSLISAATERHLCQETLGAVSFLAENTSSKDFFHEVLVAAGRDIATKDLSRSRGEWMMQDAFYFDFMRGTLLEGMMLVFFQKLRISLSLYIMTTATATTEPKPAGLKITNIETTETPLSLSARPLLSPLCDPFLTSHSDLSTLLLLPPLVLTSSASCKAPILSSTAPNVMNSEELKVRSRKLVDKAERKEYEELVQDITLRKEVAEPFSSYRDYIGFVTMFSGCLVGYAIFMALFNQNPAMNAAGGVLGLVCAMLVETLLLIITTSNQDLFFLFGYIEI
ncbi:hypothetical protein RJ641_008327 [Dillenia turbinata]|uniref:Uncharacterized protein n=1 Tax=Dillenia turbinata TaxID=194707 RepID=A0AAN8VFF3_9MAGN